MRLTDYLDPQAILLDLPSGGKEQVFAAIAGRLAESGLISDQQRLLSDVLTREEQGGTAIGRGLAFPHARTRSLERIVMAMARLRPGADFGAEDGEPVRLVFLLGAPEDKAGEYLKLLGRLSKLMKENGLRKELLKAPSPQTVLDLLETAEAHLP
jgi:mannitol/fructose-specific phosphotransferase system IIA component (Ntr-type)